MDPPAPGMIALVARDPDPLRFPANLPDDAFAVVTVDQKAFFAYGTKEIAAVIQKYIALTAYTLL